MYFNRISHPANFMFATAADMAKGKLSLDKASLPFRIAALGGDVYRLTVDGPAWTDHFSQAELAAAVPGENRHAVALRPDGTLAVTAADTGRTVLAGVPGATFGTCGAVWMFQFRHEPDMQFYGLGEHSKGLEKTGERVKFWNTDLFGDFAHCEIHHSHANPMYVALPWLIVKQGNHYAGILVHNPGAVFMDLASNFVWSEENAEDRDRRSFYVGARSGRPEIFLIVGPSLPELTRKLQVLVGRTPLPPLWALGHHQCRWGYAGPGDLRMLDRQFRRHEIPCDGFWLDIDYMDGYRVFTYAAEHWPSAAARRRVLAGLKRRGRRVVPILDPGVKLDPGYAVCRDGLRTGAFCLNPAGQPFVGFVWPGKTYMPDFSLPEVRAWWAEYVRRMTLDGFAGYWIDMNDPAVGAVELSDMLFARGQRPHESYHNQYALGMAQATHAGLVAGRPDERPFLLSRSAYLSSSRYTALWTGDNVSNWHHLRLSLPISMGLALSSVPFSGPDVCGYMGDTTRELAVAWYKACFLFPFLRNHTTRGARAQEPWAFGAGSRIIAHYIRLRYKFLPYLYQLFVAQAEHGEAILRPLLYDFPDTPALPLGTISDQFMIGSDLMQAPVVEEGSAARLVVLPGDRRWFGTHDGLWQQGGGQISVRAVGATTPLYVREGAILPAQPGERRDNRNDLATVELHCFVRRDSTAPGRLRYVCDDGLSFGYQRGERTMFTVEATPAAGGILRLAISDVVNGYKPARIRVVLYDRFDGVKLVREGRADRRLSLAPLTWKFTGRALRARATPWYTLT